MTTRTETRPLFEAASLVGDMNADGLWKVRLISEGKGSSGVYTASLLENHHSALNDLLSFKNHPVGWDGPEARDFTMIAGEIVGETWIEKDERGLVAVYGNYRPDPEYKEKLARYKGKLGVSIYIEGSGYYDENEEFIVDWLNPADPYASLDVVIAAGARGKFEESLKSFYAQRSADRPSTTSVQERKEIEDMATVEERLDALTAAVESLVSAQNAKIEQEAQVKVNEEAVTERLDAYDAAIATIDAAELLPPQIESLRAEAKKGADVAPLIEQAKKIRDAAIEAAKTAEPDIAGKVLGEAKYQSASDLGKVFG